MVNIIFCSDETFRPLLDSATQCVRTAVKASCVKITRIEIGPRDYLGKLKAAAGITKGRCCFVDADLFLRSEPLWGEIPDGAVGGVRDPGVIFDLVPLKEDAARLDFPADLYCNTGLFVWDAGNRLHRRAFQVALDIAREVPLSRLVDFGEQSYLNAAWHRLGIPVHLLPASHNFFVSEPILSLQRLKGDTLENAVGIHLAGFAGVEGKLGKLRELVKAGHLPLREEDLDGAATHRAKGGRK